MDRRRFLSCLAAGAAALAAAGAPGDAAAQDELSKALAEITKARASVKNLVAPFTQVRTIGLLATEVQSEGEMTLVRPDRLRWELKGKDAITYWITPEGFAFATPQGSTSVGKGGAGRFDLVLKDMLIMLGGDLEELRARYDLSVPSREGGITLVARPKTDDVKRVVKTIEMTAGPELWSVRRVVLEEKNGDKSVITFGKVTRDAAVDPAKMKPPAK
jgi:outer membrane lipoprotein-sorting protein